jgi:hypothetical protein
MPGCLILGAEEICACLCAALGLLCEDGKTSMPAGDSNCKGR